MISPWWQRWLLHSKLIRLALSPLLITRENQSSFLRPIKRRLNSVGSSWSTHWRKCDCFFSLRSQFVRLYAVILCNAFGDIKMHPVCLGYIRGVNQNPIIYPGFPTSVLMPSIFILYSDLNLKWVWSKQGACVGGKIAKLLRLD